ncbi:hypothetical protein D9M72_650680 [compost metagenome]
MDRRLGRWGRFQLIPDAGAVRPAIEIDGLDEELCLAAEGGVEARRFQPHRLGQIG